MTDTKEAQVLATLEGMAAAWNADDATAYADHFTEDADYITFFGMNVPGRQKIEELRRAMSQGPMKGAKLVGGGAPPKIRFLRPDVAVVLVGGGSSLDGKPVQGTERESLVSYVLVCDDDRWRVASFQNTRVTDPKSWAGK